MAARWKKQEDKIEMEGTSTGTTPLNVKDRIKTIEQTSPEGKAASLKRLPKCHLCQRALGSRFSGLVLGPLFGLFLYYYITYLILSGPPFTRSMTINETIADTETENAGVATDGGTSSTESKEVVLLDDSLSHIIGGATGGIVGVALVVGGLTSRRTRCAMLLMIPSLVSKRGRAFMISAAVGFMLSGPLATIDVNIQEVVRSFTCLYENMKEVGQQYVDEFKRIYEAFGEIFQQINQTIQLYKDELARLARGATKEVRDEIAKSQRAVEEQSKKLKKELDKLKGVLEAPGNVAGAVCGAGKSAVSWVKGAGKTIGSWFGRRRRKRNACGIPPVVPNIDINAPDIDISALKDFLKTLDPDINLIDFDFDQVFSQLQANSIPEIRLRLKNILKSVFEMIRTYAKYASKIFYLSILLIIWDAYSYMHKYYSDDAFDNMFVDDNLRQLWRSGDKEKILPLRKWELNLKYQYSSSIKLSKVEAKHILIQSIPTLIFIILAASILGFDAALTGILQVFKDNAKFGIAYEGMETGIGFSSLLPGLKSGDINPAKINLRGFNLSTEPCLPQPRTTDYGQTGIIAALIVLCLLSCILDAFGSRLRAKICNLVFHDRAVERAEYLYKRIKTGRAARRIQFNMIICHQLDIIKRKAQFCFCCNCWKQDEEKKSTPWFGKIKSKDTCLSCKKAYSVEEGHPYKVTHGEEKKQVMICSDCNTDAM